MRAMVLKSLMALDVNPSPLELAEWPDPVPGVGEVVIRVSVCGVCHTELDEIEGRASPPNLPIIPGHQAVGRVESVGPGVSGLKAGDRVGAAWIWSACGTCAFCRSDRENLCRDFIATGRDAHGGYAELMAIPAAFTFPIPDIFSDAEAAPLLCAGAVGYRALRLTNIENGQNLGFTGFGASAHLVLQLVKQHYPDTKTFVFARDKKEQEYAMTLGATWAGNTMDSAPEKLHAIIDTTPAWKPMASALRSLERGGRLVVNALRKEETDKAEFLKLDYEAHLWLEKEIKTAANVTRRDVHDFLKLAAKIPLRPEIQEYTLEDANLALLDLKQKHVKGAKILRIQNNGE